MYYRYRKRIRTKDSKSYGTGVIGKRENVLLVHPKITRLVAELTRSFVIEKIQMVKNNQGRASKETKLALHASKK